MKFRNNIFRIFSILAIVSLLTVSTISAGDQSSARAVALGNAYTSLASGIDAARFNPANLGFETHRETGIELIGVGAVVNNNSFTLDDYNKYNGSFLTSDDKDDILNKIPDEGLKLKADIDASVFGVSTSSLAFFISGNALAEMNLNRDLVDLVLNGNTFADTIDVTGSYSEGVAYAAAGVAYGTTLYKSGYRQLTVGATAKYLKGFGIEKVVKMTGSISTQYSGYDGQGELIAQTSTGGSGYALDLGAALKINNNYVVGARIENFVSSLKWTEETEEHGYLFNFDTMTVDNMGEDFVTSEEYSEPIGEFETDLPSVMNIGFAKINGSLKWSVDWEQGFSSKTGSSTKPRFSAGGEYMLLSFLPVRAGFSTGGNYSSSFSFGSGFNLPVFYIDYAMVTGNSISGGSSKGINFAITTGLHF